MTLLFDFVFLVYAVCYLPILILRGKWHPGFKERAGFLPPETKKALASGRNIWLHAVSVGEVAAIDGVLRRIQVAHPDKRVVLSVTTKAGYALARTKYAADILILHAPLDFSLTVRAFVRMIRPVVYIAAETELWPNLFRELGQNSVPILIINGRISDASYPRYRLIRRFLGGMLKRVRVFCMQSELDAQRIKALGAPGERVKVVGNVKFDNAAAAGYADSADTGFSDRDLVLVGGSTHPGEEEILVDSLKALRERFPGLKLILAPRHPERSAAVAEIVRDKGFVPVLFSQRGGPLREEEVLIVDGIGKLLKFYAIATVVFVGKSLTARGGHNIIEPALFRKPVVVGPYMENFRDIVRMFIMEGAVVQVEDSCGLQKAVAGLLERPELREDVGQRAGRVVQKNAGAAQRTMDVVAEVLK